MDTARSNSRRSARFVVGLTTIVMVGSLVHAVPAAASPPDATAPPTQEQIDAEAAPVACPELAGLALQDRNVSWSEGTLLVQCRYEQGVQLRVDIDTPAQQNPYACTRTELVQDDPQYINVYGVVRGTAALSGQWDLQTRDLDSRRADFDAAARAMVAAAEPLAQGCPTQFDCAEQLGELGLTFPDQTAADIRSDGGIFRSNCWWSPPDDLYDTHSDAIIVITWAGPSQDGSAVSVVCSAETESDRGIYIVDGPDDLAMAARIDFRRPARVYDLDAALAEAERQMALLAPETRACDGIETFTQADIYTPVPPWLTTALADDLAVGAPTLALVEGGGTIAVTVGADTGRAVAPDIAGSSTPGTSADGTATPAAPAGSDRAAPGAAVAGSSGGWQQTVMRVAGWIMLVVSVLGLVLTLLLMRRESRVRPKLEIARLAIMLLTAIVTMLLLRRSTPGWVIAVALVGGGMLGLVQGRYLAVRVAGRKIMARRSSIAVVAFLIGLVLSQGAGLANRFGVLAIGVGLTFLSAALAAGIMIGRRPALLEARRVAGMAALLAIMTAPVAALMAASDRGVDAAATDPEASEEARAYLDSLVDWSEVTLLGGFGIDDGKPPTVLSIPPRFADAPDTVTNQVQWTSEANGATVGYDLAESYLFGLTLEGLCCAVDYTVAGTVSTTRADGTVSDEPVVGEAALGTVASLQEPFGPKERLFDDSCGRSVADFQPSDTGAWTKLTVGDQDRSTYGLPRFGMVVDCALPGFTISDALGRAPTPPPADDPARAVTEYGQPTGVACPVLQEVVSTVDDPTWNDDANTHGLTKLYLDPNGAACSGDFDLGDEVKGGRRGELSWDFATADPEGEGYRQWDIADSFLLQYRLQEIEPERRCEPDAQGVPTNLPGQEDCVYRSFHHVADGRVTIWTDTDTSDGPNTEVRGDFPWGSYMFRCHHCTPGDPVIASTIESWHRFGSQQGGNAPGGDTTDDAGEDGSTDSRSGDSTPVQGDDVPAGATQDVGAAGDDGIAARDALLAALAGLLGAAGVAGATLAESGLSVQELLDALRRDGLSGLGDGAGGAGPDLATPDGPGDDGMYDWGGRRVSPEEYGELLAQEAAIEADRQARIDGLIALMESEDEAAARFGDMRNRSIDDDRRARDALNEELETLRNQTRTRERVAEMLEERARAGGWDPIADRIANGEALSREELISIRTTLDRLSEQQSEVDFDETGSFETDLLDEFAKDAATAQEVLATLAEHSPAGPLGGWVVRHPAAAGRIAAALGTGGLSEGIITPWEIAEAMERAAERAHAEGRDLTYGEAVAAGLWQAGPGMLIGKIGQIGIDRFGRAIAEAAEDGLGAASRQLDEFLGAAARTGAREGVESVASRAAAQAARPPRMSPQELSELKTQVADALRSGDDDALRAVYQNGGMRRLGELEAAGAMDRQTANALVDFHDRLTGNAIRQGTHDTIDEFARLNGGIRPREVLVANSGSVGAGRSVVTDADRTISTTFSNADIDRWIAGRGGSMTRSEAAREMRAEFTSLHQANVGRNLNPPGTATPVSADDMDISSYSGFRGGTSHTDIYPTGYTQSRMATQGSTEVYRVSPNTGEATVHTTSGQAIIDHNLLEEARFTGNEIPRVDGWPLDPTRIPNSELAPLLNQQRDAIAHYTDVKSIAKALDRAEYIASRSGQPMSNQTLVDAAVRIRTDPRQTAAVLHELNMTEAQFVAASRDMMNAYAPSL